MPITRTRRGTAGRAAPARTKSAGVSPGVASVVALQRSAGNVSTLALMRRTRTVADEPPVALTVPGVADRVAVSSWRLDDVQGRSVGLNVTRHSDTNSPRLAQAVTSGAPAVTATLLVRKLTPLGWVRELTLTMEGCMVASYQAHEDYELVGLTFSRMRIE